MSYHLLKFTYDVRDTYHHSTHILLTPEEYTLFVKHGGRQHKFPYEIASTEYSLMTLCVWKNTHTVGPDLLPFLNDKELHQTVTKWITDQCNNLYLLTFQEFSDQASGLRYCGLRRVLLSQGEYTQYEMFVRCDRVLQSPGYRWIWYRTQPITSEEMKDIQIVLCSNLRSTLEWYFQFDDSHLSIV